MTPKIEATTKKTQQSLGAEPTVLQPAEPEGVVESMEAGSTTCKQTSSSQEIVDEPMLPGSGTSVKAEARKELQATVSKYSER